MLNLLITNNPMTKLWLGPPLADAEAFRAARAAGADESVARGKLLRGLIAPASGGA